MLNSTIMLDLSDLNEVIEEVINELESKAAPTASLNLTKLENQLDEPLAAETTASLSIWLYSKRIRTIMSQLSHFIHISIPNFFTRLLRFIFPFLYTNPTEETTPSPDPSIEYEDAASLNDDIGCPADPEDDGRFNHLEHFTEPYLYPPVSDPKYLWCLDNGHGRLQAGKRSPTFEDGTRFEEWEFNRIIVRGIIKVLAPLGVQIYNVVPEDEIGKFLQGRVERANNKQSDLPKIFVSVHANAAPLLKQNTFREDVKGIETFAVSAKGRFIAETFQRYLVNRLQWRNRGVKTANFYVLKNTEMPAVLTETGFYTSEEQAKDLLDPAIQEKIILAHCEAILEIEKDGFV